MAVNVKAFLAIETALAERLKKSWREIALSTFTQVKMAVDRRDYHGAVEIARKVDMARVIKENRAQMEMSAYSALLFGATRATQSAKDTVVMKRDFSTVVEDSIRVMEQTIKVSAEEQVREVLLDFVYRADMEDPRTPFYTSKAEWVRKYDPDQPRAPEGDPRGGQWIAVSTGTAYDLAVEEGNFKDVTEDAILSALPADKLKEYKNTLANIGQAIRDGKETYKVNSVNGDGTGGYTPERLKVHDRLIDEALANWKNYLPKNGEKPTVIFLGGRGGSGKSEFNKAKNKDVGVYTPDQYLVLDSDEFKNALAREDGSAKGAGNLAALYHKESDQLTLRLMKKARAMGLNTVFDVTLKSPSKGKIAKTFQKSGYRLEGHYMFLPRGEAAKRALARYEGGGRLVPPKIILGNTKNERNFDRMIPLFDKWSIYNNNVPRGQKPKLVASSKKGE